MGMRSVIIFKKASELRHYPMLSSLSKAVPERQGRHPQWWMAPCIIGLHIQKYYNIYAFALRTLIIHL